MRKTDPPDLYFIRSPDRIYCADDVWFARTREGVRGPFSKRRTAEAEASLFVETMQYLDRSAPLGTNVDR